jgi:hypothetical protein
MPPETLPPTEPSTPTEISRRKLLKMLTVAGAGASAAVLLSGQWVKPVAAGGKLAPHAQTSQPQPTTHVIVSGSAQQNLPAQQIQAVAPLPDSLSASCTISPVDPNIPMVATVYADLSTTPTLAPAVQTLLTTLQANTDATGTATFADTALPGITCQNVPPSGTTATVVFTFANDPADGTGSLTKTTPWTVPC